MPVTKSPFGTSPPGRKLCDENSSFSYIWTHDNARAYQTLWEDASDFGNFWKEVAHTFSGEPGVIGGELWNEPFPGDVFGNPKNRDNLYADLNNLQPFYFNVTKKIREAAPKKSFAIAYEPSWPVGTQDIHPDDLLSPTSGFSSLPEKDSIYAFHYYSAPCDPDVGKYLDARLADARRLEAAPFASEFNLAAWDEGSMADMTKTFNAFESRLISYTGWQYKSYAGSLPGGTCTGCGNSFFNDPSGIVNTYMLQAMARPFASAVAGKTITSEVNGNRKGFILIYACNSSTSSTKITVPHLYLTPSEMKVTVIDASDGKVAAADQVKVTMIHYEGGSIEGKAPFVFQGHTLLKIKAKRDLVGKKVHVTLTAADGDSDDGVVATLEERNEESVM